MEIRSWRTHYRGPIIVCASLQRDRAGDEPIGYALGVVFLTAVDRYRKTDTQKSCIKYIPEHFSWVLENPVPIDPIRIKGRLSLFDPPTAVRKQVVAALR